MIVSFYLTICLWVFSCASSKVPTNCLGMLFRRERLRFGPVNTPSRSLFLSTQRLCLQFQYAQERREPSTGYTSVGDSVQGRSQAPGTVDDNPSVVTPFCQLGFKNGFMKWTIWMM
ncbi:hypothetical protein BJ878DRAFT_511088 [Calycina marina]|uniref:Secreted protein n=1 Tax=Calycina marina TaxID=1763456 RepID=A0A9P8CDT8_9HELO|nr:hypothetical protein BJ878DRAFT_511088 [Calycina marina]